MLRIETNLLKTKEIIKLNYRTVALELTRRCNLKCSHCMRGEAQNMEMEEKIIDLLAEQVNSIEFLYLTGGEPLLNAKLIKYIADKVTSGNLNIGAIDLTTNGTILDKTVELDLNRMAAYCKNKYGYTSGFGISNDNFHGVTDKEKCLQFYSNYCGENMIIKIKEDKKPDGGLTFSGKAKDFVNDKSKIQIVLYNTCHRIEFETEKAEVKCPIEISALGNFHLAYGTSYKDDDKPEHIIGNLYTDNMADKIKEWQWRYPITCKERWAQTSAFTKIFHYGDVLNPEKQSCEQTINDINLRLEWAKAIHNEAPDVGFGDISNMIDTIQEYQTTDDPSIKAECEKQLNFYDGFLQWAKQEDK